ncbi:MAG: PH domain-containing protein [bacterium]
MDDNEIIRIHPSMKNFLSFFILPIALAPAVILLIKLVLWKAMPFWPWMVLILLAAGLLPFFGWLQTRFHTYEVRSESVMARKGLISRFTAEIRIVDIRLVNVRQNMVQRILNIGRVGFASAAGGEEEIVFADVPDPTGIKALVQQRMKSLRPEGDE